MKKLLVPIIFFVCLFYIAGISLTYGQTELQAWGNITGIRVDGQLMKFETSVVVVQDDWNKMAFTGKERQPRPIYKRESPVRQVATNNIDSLFLTVDVTDVAPASAKATLNIESRSRINVLGIFFRVRIPGKDYENAMLQLIEPTGISLNDDIATAPGTLLQVNSKGFNLAGEERKLEVTFDETSLLIVRKEQDDYAIYVQIVSGQLNSGDVLKTSYSLTVGGKIDRTPVTMTLDASNPGRVFDGIGGNFRLQNPTNDPPVIDYCLKNMRVAWARVEMPWMLWHPVDSISPLASANKGNLHPHVKESMEMAQRLYKMGIPVILSAWFPPRWAVNGELNFRPLNGVYGNQLNQERAEEIYASITDYVIYLKQHYGVDIRYFSFNESDLGINVRQTDKEHTILIKGLGAYFKSKGLKTTLLLGDTADANGYAFVDDAIADNEAGKYMGAVSFHSWRGWDFETLNKWRDASLKTELHLFVGEGSIDAAAWRYPGIFEEQTYAMEEINLYVRMMAICQPITILQWQLTSDYSLLAGGGIFGNTSEPMRPTKRFYNLKQLASTKPGLKYLPVSFEGEDISCAALADEKGKNIAIHIVNNGPTREITISGIPSKVKSVDEWITDATRNMQKVISIPVKNGRVTFTADQVSFISLTTK